MANEKAGTIHCPMCEETGELRRYKNHKRGKLYISCGCGQVRPALNQGYILRNGDFIAGPLAPDPEEIEDAKAAYQRKKPVNEETPPPPPVTELKPVTAPPGVVQKIPVNKPHATATATPKPTPPARPPATPARISEPVTTDNTDANKTGAGSTWDFLL